MVKVSIIMPSLNVASYIKEAIQSVRIQTLKEIEIICIDAGSTDGTLENIQRQATDDDRIVIINSPIKSYGYQVNMGIKSAHGEYIAILETDDYINDTMYEKLYNIAQKHDCDYVKSDYYSYWTQKDGTRNFISKRVCINDERYGYLPNPLKYHEKEIFDWYIWNGIYKKQFIIDNNISLSETKGAAYQDIGFLFKTIIGAKRIGLLNEPLYNYCIDREDSSSNSGNALKFVWQEYSQLIKYQHNKYQKKLLYLRMCKSYVRAVMSTGLEHLRSEENVQWFDWFRFVFEEAEKNGDFDEEVLPEVIKRDYFGLLQTEDEFWNYVDKRKREFIKFIGQNMDCTIAIFGCGSYGYLAYRILNKNGYNVTAFFDNNKKLHGTKFDDVTIKNPDDISTMIPETKYIVASENYSDDIKKQILNYSNVKASNVFTFIPL